MGRKTDLESVHLLNHSKCMLGAFQNFRQDETMLDVTLVCNGKSLKAHKLVLASCSQFFKELFSENPCKHPIVILRHFDFDDLKACIDFIYKGELSVPRERLMSALKMAEDLNIRGLMPSGTNREVYKKFYNQFCGKPSHRKKRKRHRHNSADSQGSSYINVSDSDQNVESVGDNVAPSESQVMDVESVITEKNSTNEKEVRPLVLRVGDLSASNEESISKVGEDEGDSNAASLLGKNLSADDVPIESSSVPNDTEGEIYETVSENIELSSQFDAYATYSGNSNLDYVPGDEQNNSQDQSMESVSVSEDLEKQSAFMPCVSPNSLEAELHEETRPPDEGKRFVCSKCDSVFTSRISFMKHKAMGHNNMEKNIHQCQYCTYSTEDMDCLKQHLLTHTDSVPYKCSTCAEEFTSEDVYQKHVSLHEVEEITLHGFSAVDEKDLLSTQNKNSAKNLEFRCSICFVKFNSKLRCQIHEKSCQECQTIILQFWSCFVKESSSVKLFVYSICYDRLYLRPSNVLRSFAMKATVLEEDENVLSTHPGTARSSRLESTEIRESPCEKLPVRAELITNQLGEQPKKNSISSHISSKKFSSSWKTTSGCDFKNAGNSSDSLKLNKGRASSSRTRNCSRCTTPKNDRY